MKSAGPGLGTSGVEIANLTPDGFELWLGNEKLQLCFSEFPWFRGAAIGALTQVERPSPEHLYWPILDIDLDVESIRHPEQFPLVSRVFGRG